MDRRTFLAQLAAGGGVALAGCTVTHVDTSTPTPREDHTPERSQTATAPTASAPRPGDVPGDRVFVGEAIADYGVGVRAERWFAHRELSYGAGTVTSDRGWFVAYDFTITNHGESGVGAIADSKFTLRIDDATVEHMHEFPGGVPFSAIEQPTVGPRVRELAWYRGLGAGESVSLQLVFEAPVSTAFKHYLAWDPPSPVAGSEDPVYLHGDRVRVDR